MPSAPLFLVATGAIALATALPLFRAWWQEEDGETRRLLGAWSLSNLVVTVGALVIGLQPQMPLSVVIVGGNGAILLSFSLIWAGLRVLRGKAAPWWALLAPAAVWCAACSVPAFYASVGARVLLITIVVFGLIALLAAESLAARRELGLRSLDDLFVVLGLMALRAAFRAADVLAAQGPAISAMTGLLTLVILAGLGFVGLGIARERAARRDTALHLAEARRADAAEESLRSVFQTMAQGIMSFGPDGRLRFANRQATDLLDLPAGTDAAGRPASEIGSWHAAPDGQGGSGGAGPFRPVQEHVRADGRVIEVRTVMGPTGGTVLTFTDITARKQAEAAVQTALDRARKAEATLSVALANIDQGVLMVDADGIIRVVNRRVVDLAEVPAVLARPGISMHEVLAAQVASGLFADQPRILESVKDGTIASYMALGRYERQTSGGRTIEVRSTPLPGGGGVRTFTDITDSKRAGQEMAASLRRAQEAEATLSAAIENVPQAIAFVGADSRIRLTNRRMSELLGIPPEVIRPGADMRDALRWEIANGRFDHDPAALTRAQRALDDPRMAAVVTERIMPDGRVLEVRSIPLPDGGGIRTYTDITERHARERAVKDAEATLAVAIEAVPQGIVFIGADFRVRVANRRMSELLGLPAELLRPGLDFGAVLRWGIDNGHFATDPDALARARQSLTDRTMFAHVSERTMPDGRVLEVRSIPLPEGGGVHTFTDITERKQAERRLAQALERLQEAEGWVSAAIGNISQGIMLIDPGLVVRVLNRRAAEILGLPGELARPGVPISDIVAWQIESGAFEGNPDVEAIARATIERGMVAEVYEREDRQGRTIAIHTTPLPDGGAVRTFTDVTDSKAAQKALAEALAQAHDAERWMSAAIAHVSEGIELLDADHTIRVLNPRAVELLDLDPNDDWTGRSLSDVLDWQVARGDFKDEPELLAQVRSTIASGDIRGRYEQRMQSGRILDIRTEPVPGGGEVRTFTDITEHRRITETLAAARDAAEAAARARTEFLAVMSHEIRTPLNGVIGLSSLLQEMEGLPAPAIEHVRLIRQSGDHLLALVNNVLDLARLESGQAKLETIVFDPVDELNVALGLMQEQAECKALTLESEVAPGVPRRVTGDPARLRQVLLNLIGNAVKFTDAGSVRVTLGTAPGEAPGRHRLLFAVRDTGIGIAAEDQARLFDLFTQADSSISRRYGGSGLGLAISRRLVALMGGAIACESAPGQGSVFRFDIAVESAPEAGGARDAGAEPVAVLPRLRILLAEDNATNRFVATRMLERMGHAVEVAADGAEALAAVREGRFDLVLMDVMMPGMDGIEATRAIRALPGEVGRTPVVGATADASGEAEAACRAAGMDGFVTKPLTQAKLAEALRAAMPRST